MKWYSYAFIFGLSLLTSTSFFNCSNTGFSSKGADFTISTECNRTMNVTQDKMFSIIDRSHTKISAEDKIRCPGFFAVLDDAVPPSSMNINESQEHLKPYIPGNSLHQKLISDANNCNMGGPSNPPPTGPGDSEAKNDLIRDLVTKSKSDNILQSIRTMSDGSQWETRYHASSENRKIGDWIIKQMKAIAGNRSDISIQFFEHRNTTQPSVEAIIQGVGPNKNKFVVLGGHLDSIHKNTSRSNPDSSAPGADDNASGVATIIEVFRVLVESGIKPDASIAFYFYAAEEIGLVGSQEVARKYSDGRKEVLGVMQIDMDSFSSSATSNDIMLITDYTSPDLTEKTKTLAKQFVGLNVTYDTCDYACSDHASWNRLNYHAVIPTEKEIWTSANRIHTNADIVDSKTQPKYADKFAKLAIAFLVSLGF